jgi:hypothetical protein
LFKGIQISDVIFQKYNVVVSDLRAFVTAEDVKPSEVEEEAPKVAKPAPKKRLQKVVAKSKALSPPSSPESMMSEEKPKVEVKVRKIQVSPFNKKTKALTSKQVVQAAEAEAAARPARAGRRKVQYIISDSSSEDANDDSDDAISDFSDTESS